MELTEEILLPCPLLGLPVAGLFLILKNKEVIKLVFEEITKKFNESKLSEPGSIYLPGRIREEVGLAIGDKVKLLVDREEKAILIKTK